MEHSIALVTGTTSGLGYAAASLSRTIINNLKMIKK